MAFGVVAAVVSTVSTGISYAKGKSAAKSQKKAANAQMKINRLRNQQQKRKFLAEFRALQGETIIGGIAALGGGYESSRIEGQTASQMTQKDLAVKEFKQMDTLGAEYVGQMNRASSQAFQSQVFGQVANLAGNLGGYDKLSEIFKVKKDGGND